MAAQSFDPNDFAYTSVVYLTVNFGGEAYQGSGVLISPDEVLTADHMVWDSAEGVATGVQVSPAYGKGVAPFGTVAGTVTHYDAGIVDDEYISLADAQSDFAVIHLAHPVTGAGNMAVTPGFAGGAVHVTGYPGFADEAMVDDAQSVSADPSYTLWDGTTTGAGSSGGPVWAYGADGTPDVVGLVSGASGAVQYDMRITPDKAAQIAAWVAQDDAGLGVTRAAPPAAKLAIFDNTTQRAVADALSQPFVQPIAGVLSRIVEQYVSVSPDSLSITAHSPNYFIHTGSGNDAVQLLAGTNIVDAGAGSNFVVGGEGQDTIILDTRGAVSDIWDTVSRFGSGDAAALLGLDPATARLSWADGQGAPGVTGLTLHATAPGGARASLTLAGYTTADLAAGRVTTFFGHDSNATFLWVAAT